MKNIKYIKVGDGYVCQEDYTYYSPRYKKEVTVHKGFYSDGATGAIDWNTDSFWIHDVVCRYGEFDDGTLCTNFQASTILCDILKKEGFWLQSFTWWLPTFLFGGGACRKKMF